MSQHFDVAVVGMQLSGLVTAALLAKRGRRVLVVDHGENTLTYQRQGFKLPLVPTVVPAFDGAPHVQQVHRELGVAPGLRSAHLRPLEPGFQAVLPQQRIAVSSRREVLLTELRLAFPDLSPALEKFFGGLDDIDKELSAFLGRALEVSPGGGWWQRLRFGALLRRNKHLATPFEQQDLLAGIPPQHPLRDLLFGPLAFFGHLGADNPSTFHAVRLLARYFGGVVAADDNLDGLHHTVVRAARDAGAYFREGALVERIGVRGRRLCDLMVEDDRHGTTADFFVANTVTPFHDLLSSDQRHPKFVLENQSVDPVGCLLVLNVVVHKQVIPLGMGEVLFILNGRRRLRGEDPRDPPLLLRRYPTAGDPAAKDADAGDEDREVLSVACPVRRADVATSPERFAHVKRQMKARLARVIPFLDRFVTDTSLPVETSGWDLREDGAPRRVDPWLLHPIYEPAQRPLLGVAARSVRTYYKNLAHCGRDVLPGLGIEGEYITGLTAANTLCHWAGKAWQTPEVLTNP